MSTVTGTWIQPEDWCDPDYWARNLRQPVRFSDAGGAIEIVGERDAGWVIYTVRDFGAGIPDSMMPKIFQPFEGYGPAVRMIDWPDSYRAMDGLEGEALADAYAEKVREAIDSFAQSGIPFAGMIVCPIFANEGLPNIPPGYMQKAIGYVRDAGGLFIASLTL